MVIIDGVATRSRLVKAVNLEGKAIETIEGFQTASISTQSSRPLWAGAVQCGLCIPGMIMSKLFLNRIGLK